MLVHYVEYYYPGSFFPETSEKKIKSRKDNLDIPNNCYGYRFFDKEEITKNGRVLKSGEFNHSHMTFFGKKYTLEELKTNFPKERILISNIKNNGYKYAVKTIAGNWQGVNGKDKVIDKQ